MSDVLQLPPDDHQAALEDLFQWSRPISMECDMAASSKSLENRAIFKDLTSWSESLPDVPGMAQSSKLSSSSQSFEIQPQIMTITPPLREATISPDIPLRLQLQRSLQPLPIRERESSPDLPLRMEQQLHILRSETNAVKEHLQKLIQCEGMMGSYRFGSWFDKPQTSIGSIGYQESRTRHPQLSSAITASNQRLPSEVISIVGDFLAGDNAFSSLASLNATNYDINLHTLPALYEITIWDSVNVLLRTKLDPSAPGFRIPPGFAYTKYLILDEDDARDLEDILTALDKPLAAVFPRLVMNLLKYRKSVRRPAVSHETHPRQEWNSQLLVTNAPHRCEVELFLPITARMLNYILKDLPIRWETATRTVMAVHEIDSVEKITLKPGGRIRQDTEPLNTDLYYRQDRHGPGLKLELDRGMVADEGTRQTLQAILEMIMFPERGLLSEPVRCYQQGLYQGQEWELRISGCSVEVYRLFLELLPELIPGAIAYNLTIKIQLEAPSLATFAEAAILFEHAVSVYSDLWPTLTPRRRQRAYFIPFLELRGLVVGDSPEIHGYIKPERGKQGRRFEYGLEANYRALEGYPRLFGFPPNT